MHINFIIVLIAALVPMIIGFIYYNPKTLGAAWMKAAEVSEEKMKGANMLVIFGVSLLLSFLLAFELQFLAIHQFSVYSMLNHYIDPHQANYSEDVVKYLADMME